jgi:hypothetical protein
MFRRGGISLFWYQFCPFLRFFYWIEYHPVWTFPPQSNWKIVENVKIDTLTNKYHHVLTFPPQCNRKIVERIYLFVRVSILTFSTIFQLDCGGNVQTGWYLFVRVSILPFSTIFNWIVVEMFRRGGISLFWYQFCPVKIDTLTNKYHHVLTFPPQCNRKIVERIKIDTLTNKYHPVWTFLPQSNRKIVQRVKINFALFYDFSIGLWWKCSDGVVFLC